MSILLTALSLLSVATAVPEIEAVDSLRTTDIEEIVVVSTPKEDQRLRQQPLSSTSLAQDDLQERGIADVKALSAHVPNLFIPAYGSRLTTAVYIRGIGSRVNTPSVALYVDGVPQVSAASYDFNFSGIDRIDVLRGPQSTLYGRNSMGGVIRMFTKNPLHYQGTDLIINGARAADGKSAGIGHHQVSATHYHRINDRFAFSVNLFGERDGGYFRNAARDNEYIDEQTDLGARMRFVFQPSNDLHLELAASHEWLKQGGYPYEYQGTAGSPSTPEPTTQVGEIAYDSHSGYRRNLTNVGLTAEKQWEKVTLTSVMGFQHLNDQMDLDQDFTSTHLYTLMQRQNASTVSEELILKNNKPLTLTADKSSEGFSYAYLFGAAGFRQWLETEAPVAFHDDGLAWLNGLINRQGNAHLPTVTNHDAAGNPQYTMNFVFSDHIQGDELAFSGTYQTPVTNGALFHQSTFRNLFGAKNLTLTAGLRLDYEHFDLSYDAGYSFTHRYGLGGRLTYPDGSVNSGMNLVPARNYKVADGLNGSLQKEYLQLLPRVTLQYAFAQETLSNPSTLYATVSRGYRSGGYNIQMFSDLLQTRMQTAIMKNVANATVPVVDNVTMMPTDAKQTVRTLLIQMGTQKATDVDAATWYKPETTWNYEVGAHLNFWEGRLTADIAAFWMETSDQQVSKMSSGGLGRVTVNSGKSRSIGGEVALRFRVTDLFLLQTAYGYTYAQLRNETPYTFVPFIPRNTFSIGASKEWPVAGTKGDVITLHADYRGAGRIYWTESNDVWQDFAGTLHARLSYRRVTKLDTEVAVYGNNLLSQRIQTFYFETMQRGFAQYTRPAELGLQLRFRF